jgi:hypothetical protein
LLFWDHKNDITAKPDAGDAEISKNHVCGVDEGDVERRLCPVVKLSRSQIIELTERPAIARAFWWAAPVDEATLREWLVNIGLRLADERVAHLLCERRSAFKRWGSPMVTNTSFRSHKSTLPIRWACQTCTNRILQRSRADKLITRKGKHLNKDQTHSS